MLIDLVFSGFIGLRLVCDGSDLNRKSIVGNSGRPNLFDEECGLVSFIDHSVRLLHKRHADYDTKN